MENSGTEFDCTPKRRWFASRRCNCDGAVARLLVSTWLVALVSCATHRDLSMLNPFDEQIGASLRTLRVTYLYDFPHSPPSLWNHPHRYGIAEADGEIVRHEAAPEATCPSGSRLWLRNVRLTQGFDSPEVVEAWGTIECAGEKREFRYVWGSRNAIHAAPWESAVHGSQKTRPLALPD